MESLTCFVFLLVSVFQLINASFDINDVSTWLNYDLSSLESARLHSIIGNASKSLQETGAFIVPQFLKSELTDLIAIELKTVKHIPRTSTRTVFQDKGDFVNFDRSSPRNFMMENSMEFVSRIDVEEYETKSGVASPLISLYNYGQVLEFWRKIVNTTELYPSTDKAGSIYGFYGQPNDWFTWHFDESPFSCITMIEKPESGGFFRYILMDNPIKTPNAEWNELDTVLHNEESVKDRIKSITVNEGDIYCMFGNQTLHEVTKVEGTKPRSVFVMTYGNTHHFKHTDNVNSLNEWGNEASKNEL